MTTIETINEKAADLAKQIPEIPLKRFLFIRGNFGFERLHKVCGKKVKALQGSRLANVTVEEAISRALFGVLTRGFGPELFVEWRSSAPIGYKDNTDFGGTELS